MAKLSTVSMSQYLGKYAKEEIAPATMANADRLLASLNRLLALAISEGVLFIKSPATGNLIAHEDGGYRGKAYKGTGAAFSAHKTGEAVDIFDGVNTAGRPLMTWLRTSKTARELYETLGLYFEHPDYTKGNITSWVHVTTRRPASGNRFFKP